MFIGGEDYGGGPIPETTATSALVLQLVGLRGRWKIPVAYFFTDHVKSEMLASVIRDTIHRAYEFGIHVKAVVSDGLAANFKAGQCLGANMATNTTDHSFFVNKFFVMF